eukprot:3989283-Pleurochrysis_carterae.AAC.1
MGLAYDLLEDAMVAAADNGAYLFDPSLNIFGAIADEQPVFKKYLEEDMRNEKVQCLPFSHPCLQVRSPDGTRTFEKYERVLSEAQNPEDATNIAETSKTVELIE